MPRAVDKMSAIFEEYRKTNWPQIKKKFKDAS
jgi:hypothetical protein